MWFDFRRRARLEEVRQLRRVKRAARLRRWSDALIAQFRAEVDRMPHGPGRRRALTQLLLLEMASV